MQMFNLTEYMSYLLVNDPVMLVVQFLVIPGLSIIGLQALYSKYEERKKRAWVNAK
jgi:hypothetical protein